MKYDDQVASICGRHATGEMGYPETLGALVEAYRTRRTLKTSLAPLLSLLGCHNVRSRTAQSPWVFVAPPQPAAEHEEVVVQNLLIAVELRSADYIGSDLDNMLAIIDGLTRNDRWRVCLSTVRDAHNLALLMLQGALRLNTLERSRDNQICWLASTSEPALYAMINAWTTPDKPFTRATTLSDMACAMFGNAWFDLTFGGERWYGKPGSNAGTGENFQILKSIYIAEPPFLPHLLSAEVIQQDGITLPLMDMP
jgi:hypothetical protein